MQRRDFINTTLLVCASGVLPQLAFANDNKNSFGIEDKYRVFKIENDYILKSGDIAKLWVPLPLDASFQKLLKISFEGNFDEAFVSQNSPYDTRLLYAKWSKSDKPRELKVRYEVVEWTRATDFSKATDKTNYPKGVAEFLKGTPHTPVSKFLTDYAANITKNAKTPLQKAQKIYDWTTTNMYRDESVKGCGLGDATKVIEQKAFGGKCTDISSVFVALLRNAGIPAREMFGIRAGQSKISNACGKADDKGVAKITGAQHCRAEFYLDGIGWVPVDAADVAKVKLQDDLKTEDAKYQNVKKYFFGSWENNWVAFNYARDFVLEPKPTQFPLNMLGYPYGEIGEDVLDYYDPKTFTYSYLSTEIK
ncbi:MAG: hypothetical protein RL154_438 [Pseudomonadota bacterium]|jgi:transglutaminase-like putative cysteine protease